MIVPISLWLILRVTPSPSDSLPEMILFLFALPGNFADPTLLFPLESMDKVPGSFLSL